MEIRTLRHFVTLARRGSFIAAAEELNITQPALSRSIRGLEEEIGQKLIVRHRNGCVPSPAGALLLYDAEGILRRMAMVQHNLRAFAKGRLGHLRFGVAPLPAALFLSPLLSRVSKEQPDLTMGVSLGSMAALLEQLRGDHIEFFICAKSRLPRDGLLAMTKLCRIPLTWLARVGHPLARRKAVTWDMLSDYPIAGVHSDFSTPRESAADTMLDMPIAIACDDYQVLLSTVAHCDAVCLASSAMLPLQTGVVALNVVEGPAKEIDIVAVSRRGREFSPAVTMLLQHIRSMTDPRDDRFVSTTTV
ncbi:LysR family transcriptional regulator [Sphingobium estronivorans]|uniref:LysR family transcriptional regulator n=1 Tax=Sphingobium estronivorans TaxID=1577690 RepID=UPI00123A8C95|nr:LysR family transcriptional regulator [Sphingobium estronivorans]